MPRLRARYTTSLMAALTSLAVCAVLGGGCTRYAETRVFLHGDVVDEEGRPVPRAVVRLGNRETLADLRGQYRFLYLTRCLQAGVGTAGYKNESLEVFSPGFEKAEQAFEIAAAEFVGPASCPKDTDKFLRVTLLPRAATGDGELKATESK